MDKLEDKINNVLSNKLTDRELGIVKDTETKKDNLNSVNQNESSVKNTPKNDVPEIVLDDKIDDDNFFDDFFDD